jgi:hypothetical protein
MRDRAHVSVGLGVVVLFLSSGCGRYKPVDPAAVRTLRRVAIVAHVDSGPLAMVAQVAARESGGNRMGVPEELDKRLAAALVKQVRRFELQERLRAEVVRKLPSHPPWSTAVPAVEVATALQSLLVEDRSGDIDLAPLAARGVDSVLELSIAEFGVRRDKGRTSLYVMGDARLFTLEGVTLWKFPLDTEDPASEGRDVRELQEGGFRDATIELVDALANRIAADLTDREAR